MVSLSHMSDSYAPIFFNGILVQTFCKSLPYQGTDLSQSSSHKVKKEAPLCISFAASYTVEAAVVLPVVLCFLAMILFLLRVSMVQIGVQNALDTVAQQTASVCQGEELTLPVVILAVSAKLASNGTPLDYVDGGTLGISYRDSAVDHNDINLTASYQMTFPIHLLGDHALTLENHTSRRKWIGWDPSEENGDGKYVYVTPTGRVYHESYNCNYLHPSISAIPYDEVEDARSLSGDRYDACRSCKAGKKKKGIVYITDYGETYHAHLSCSGLKRTIYKKALVDVSLSPCKKCSYGAGE